MTDDQLLAEQFEAHRSHLRSVALRMLGSRHEADDAVQEAWLRLSRSDMTPVENLGGWLTTVVARVCLDVLRSRAGKPSVPLDDVSLSSSPSAPSSPSPEEEAVLADSVGLALLVVLDTLAPAERLAFVLHDLFGMPFDEIAPIVGRSPVAARQLASRARRRVQSEASGSADSADPRGVAASQHEVVTAFLAASRQGDFAGLLRLLDPDVVLRAEAAVVKIGAPAEVRGPDAVAQMFSGRAQAARYTLIDGLAGAMWSLKGKPQVVFDFTVRAGRVVRIDMLGDPETLEALDLVRVRSSASG
ncbi:MAG TPA: sigma-70 family RNA polymerase sigma factor [Acidimicrobiales bacterium]|nr:sigma-70 family RNA polymerase sigma factor [Acidimicrobiales bacterium]